MGYGYDSVAGTIGAIHGMEDEVAPLAQTAALKRRREIMGEIDRKGILFTPANSYVNELVVEAARLSNVWPGAIDDARRVSVVGDEVDRARL